MPYADLTILVGRWVLGKKNLKCGDTDELATHKQIHTAWQSRKVKSLASGYKSRMLSALRIWSISEIFATVNTVMAKCRSCPRYNGYLGIVLREPSRSAPLQANQ